MKLLLLLLLFTACSSGSTSSSVVSSSESFYSFKYFENDALISSGAESILSLSQKTSVVISFQDYVHIYIKLDLNNLNSPTNTVTSPYVANIAYADPLICLDGEDGYDPIYSGAPFTIPEGLTEEDIQSGFAAHILSCKNFLLGSILPLSPKDPSTYLLKPNMSIFKMDGTFLDISVTGTINWSPLSGYLHIDPYNPQTAQEENLELFVYLNSGAILFDEQLITCEGCAMSIALENSPNFSYNDVVYKITINRTNNSEKGVLTIPEGVFQDSEGNNYLGFYPLHLPWGEPIVKFAPEI